MKNIIFISWERHQRTRSLCEKFNIPLKEVLTQKKGLARYLACCVRTFHLIKTHKPKILIIQNPSIVLAIFGVMLKPFFRYRLIVDAHNEAIIPFNLNNMAVRITAKALMRWSDLTLVTNNSLVGIVTKNGGRAFVLPDFLPTLDFEPISLRPELNATFNATLICTYAQDEPYTEVFKAAEILGNNFQLNVTGKIPQSIDHTKIPPNVKLTGYLSENEYWIALNNSHLVIDLTTMDNCLVCGAYEAIALKKPLLLSENDASIALFGQYAAHTLNTPEAITGSIQKILSDYGTLSKNIDVAEYQFRQAEIQRTKEFLHELNHE